jgi:large subunit ribosomal protein L4
MAVSKSKEQSAKSKEISVKQAKTTVKKAAVKKAPVTVMATKKKAGETLNTTQAAELVKKKTAAVRNAVKIDVLDLNGKVVETLSLPGEIFAAKVNPTLMAQAVRVYLANQRRGTVSTKTRGEVEGSTRKIYRQKGTGRARHGSIRAPIFVGGGLVFGPKPRDYSMSMPQKMRRAALFSALTTKLNDKELSVVQGFEKLEPKTKAMVKALTGVTDMKKPSVLLVIPTDVKSVENITKATRNIAGVTYLSVNQLNTYAVLRAKQLIMTKDAVSGLLIAPEKRSTT